MKRIFAALLLLPFLALGADGSYEEGLEARRAGDYTEALNQWMLASDDPRCMTAIAVMYDYGEGVSQDEGLAGEWYRRAEARGDYRAMAQLANFSLSGVGGETRSPMEWRARLEEARGKDPYVDYVLAFFYANAHGGERRLDDALALLKPLIDKGFEPFLPLYRDVEQRIADRKEGVQEASVLAIDSLFYALPNDTLGDPRISGRELIDALRQHDKSRKELRPAVSLLSARNLP